MNTEEMQKWIPTHKSIFFTTSLCDLLVCIRKKVSLSSLTVSFRSVFLKKGYKRKAKIKQCSSAVLTSAGCQANFASSSTDVKF